MFIHKQNTNTYFHLRNREVCWLSNKVLKDRWDETHRRHCTVSLRKTLYPLLVPNKTTNT